MQQTDMTSSFLAGAPSEVDGTDYGGRRDADRCRRAEIYRWLVREYRLLAEQECFS